MGMLQNIIKEDIKMNFWQETFLMIACFCFTISVAFIGIQLLEQDHQGVPALRLEVSSLSSKILEVDKKLAEYELIKNTKLYNKD